MFLPFSVIWTDSVVIVDAHILSPEDLARNPAFDEQSHYQDRSWESGDEETLRGEDKTEGVREPAPVQLKPKSRRRLVRGY